MIANGPGRRLAAVGAVVLFSACGVDDQIGWLRRPLGAICAVEVTGLGTRQVETDYLPHVVACENGPADTEALKAQAVAARSYLHYEVERSGEICDSQQCQVYTCANQPEARHFDAVRATSGQVLMWDDVVICAFYVAGAKPTTASCEALPSDPDPTDTEFYVTYNEGRSGTDVIQSPLGLVDQTNKHNRGCKSQNGADCLSRGGRSYPQILRFYYGSDIQLVTTTGPCVVGAPDGALLADAGAVDAGPRPDGWTRDGLPPIWPGAEPTGGGGCSVARPTRVPATGGGDGSGAALSLVLLAGLVYRRRRRGSSCRG